MRPATLIRLPQVSVQKTAAWPLALIYGALVIYASLYPFTGWRNQGLWPLAFLSAPLPKYWTGFDVAANVLGYAPLGFFLCLSYLRRNRAPGGTSRAMGVVLAGFATAALSLLLETLQSYLPTRVASNVDLALNLTGGFMGAVSAGLLEKWGALARWSRFRARWFDADARGALVLIALWPAALLFPAAVPFGLGQVSERLESGVAELLSETPFLDWLPVRDTEFQPLLPSAEAICVALGALAPILLGYCVIRSVPRRVAFFVLVAGLGVSITALSAALSYGPEHAWAWLSPPVNAGLIAVAVLALITVPVPRQACAALLLLSLGVLLGVLNQAATGAYFSQTLQEWEQGRFIRFHGLSQWLGWAWPYVALVWAVLRVSRRRGS